MIESRYWKLELLKQAEAIKKRQRCQRWSEKQVVMLEREIMIAFFCIRSLIERHKVTDALAQHPLPVVAYPILPGKHAHLLNCCDIDELYRMDSPVQRTVNLSFFCNQVIHSYVITAQREPSEKKFTTLIVCSDYERNRQLFRVVIKDIILVMRKVAANYPADLEYEYSEKIGDYKVTAKNERKT